MDERLYAVIDYIMNQATSKEIEVIEAAISRKRQDNKKMGGLNIDPAVMAESMTSQMRDMTKVSLQGMRKMVRQVVVDIIRREAPELDENQIGELLDAWVPDEKSKNKRLKNQSSNPNIPNDALLAMVKQFMSFSTGSMAASQQVRMEQEIPGWQERYWNAFPVRVQKMIKLYLKGKIDARPFWEEIESMLC